MKTKIALFLLFLQLAACQVNSTEMTPGSYTATASPSQRPEVTITTPVLKEVTPTSLPLTITPWLAPTPAVSLTPSPVPVPSATFTPIPTLTDEEQSVQSAVVRNLMESNGNCDLPCWWGITPGKTSAMEARQFLTSLGVKYRELKTTQEPGIDTLVLFRGFQPLPGVNIEFPFIGLKNDGVERLDLYIYRDSLGQVIDKEYELAFKKIWSPLSPETIIRKYGVPSRIFIGYRPGFPDYSLVFMYKTGIYIEYSGRFVDNSVKICPSAKWYTNLVNHFVVTLVNPEASYNIEKITDKILLYRSLYDLETVTTITKADFAKEILRLGENFCFSVKSQP
jgi:hypothetical protein